MKQERCRGDNLVLRVTMPDGSIIHHDKQIDTFVEVIERLGVERVCALGIENHRRHQPITREPIEEGNYRRDRSGKYYINTRYSIYRKVDILREIADRLGESISVDQAEPRR